MSPWQARPGPVRAPDARLPLSAVVGENNLQIRTAVRYLPAVLLPLFIILLGVITGNFSPLIISVSAILGVVITAAVPGVLLTWAAAIATSTFLLGACYVERPTALVSNGRQDTRASIVAPLLQASDHIETLSVVLPCAFEGAFAQKTIDSVWRHTKPHRLKEIIVVDDGSIPPLSLTLPQPLRLLRGGFEPGPGLPVRLIRHNKTRGLIAAKKTGGDAAEGDVIVFFDCHVKPRDGWEDAFLKQMHRAGDHRTMVVPTITSLDPDSWEEIPSAASQACYMTWNADFPWLLNPGRDVPIMSGGLLALSKRWWQETGGYDDQMVAWGGENIDQSLRTWLCGGRIELAEGAFVAHMWRDANNPKTKQKYSLPTEEVMHNKARAVSAWLDEFKTKTFSFPEYEAFVSGKQEIGNMSNFREVKERLQCAPFSSYIQRFAYIYLDSGLLPNDIFQVKEESTGLCLEREPKAKTIHGIVMSPCAGDGGDPLGIVETQLWHLGNRDRSRPGGPCCSGLMNWNFLHCLTVAGPYGGEASTSECDISGSNVYQHFKLESGDNDQSGQLLWSTGGCLVPQPPANAGQSLNQPLDECGVHVEELQSGFRLKASASRKRASEGDDGGGSDQCITVTKQDLLSRGECKLVLADCEDGNNEQVFSSHGLSTGTGFVQVHAGTSGQCLDSAGGRELLVYPCYKNADENPNQAWQIENARLLWEGNSRQHCVHRDANHISLQSSLHRRIQLASCADKIGQRLRQHDLKADGTFLLQDVDSPQKCLTSLQGAIAGSLETSLRLARCHPRHRFRALKERNQVQHVATGYCFDAGDEVTPILYPCHEPVAQRKQRFEVVDSTGLLRMMRGWEDNGRKVFFERCLDTSPQEPVKTSIEPCEKAKEAGIRWRRLNSREPEEAKLWREAKKPLPGQAQLGGGAEPP